MLPAASDSTDDEEDEADEKLQLNADAAQSLLQSIAVVKTRVAEEEEAEAKTATGGVVAAARNDAVSAAVSTASVGSVDGGVGVKVSSDGRSFQTPLRTSPPPSHASATSVGAPATAGASVTASAATATATATATAAAAAADDDADDVGRSDGLKTGIGMGGSTHLDGQNSRHVDGSMRRRGHLPPLVEHRQSSASIEEIM